MGPAVLPLLQSDSSVNVYMPTKLRKAGSMTTGTYADPANKQRQVMRVGEGEGARGVVVVNDTTTTATTTTTSG